MTIFEKFIDQITGFNPLGKRISELNLSKKSLHTLQNLLHLKEADISEVEDLWKDRRVYTMYLYGYTILLISLYFFQYFRSLSFLKSLGLLALIGALMSSGVSVLLNKQNIEKADNFIHLTLKRTSQSIRYFIAKFFTINDKSTKNIQLEYVQIPNTFIVFGSILVVSLLAKIGLNESVSKSITQFILDSTLLTFDRSTGWNIFHMIIYIGASTLQLAMFFSLEKKAFKKNVYSKTIFRSTIFNTFNLIVYCVLCYLVISLTYGFNFFEPNYNIVIAYWPVLLLGLQNFLVVLTHQIMTLRESKNESSGFLYLLMYFLLIPHLLVFVLGLQVIPGIIVVGFCYALLALYEVTKVWLKVPSFIRVLGFMITFGLGVYKYILLE
jgi:hypothetical protein